MATTDFPALPDLSRLALTFNRGNSLPRADPMRWFRFRSYGQEALFLFVYDEIECYWRAGNQGGKTYGGAALGIALARGLRTLDGLPVPRVRTPNIGYVLTQTYKQQSVSTQLAYLELLGDHPHVIGYVDKRNDYISTIWVKPDNCRDASTKNYRQWSKIVFHCAQTGNSLPGGRIDWAHADEPPKIQHWREIRARTRRNCPLYRWITATPLAREEWEELEADFEGCYMEPKRRRVLMVTDVRDNEALSEEHLQKLLESYEGDPYRDARIRGDLIDLTGKCPFDPVRLGAWLKRTKPPSIVKTQVLAERDTDVGRHILELACEYEEYFPPETDETYIGVVDPSAGVNDRYHDPCCIQIWGLKRRRLVARYNGYLGSYGTGSLAALMGWRYGNAVIDIDMGGGYGDSCLRSMTALGYTNFMLELVEDKALKVEEFRIGHKTTAQKKHAVVGDIQRAIMEDSVYVPSQAVITCLLHMQVDEIGRVAAARGRHDEDATTMGRALVCMGRLRPYQQQQPPPTTFADAVNRDFGRTVVPAANRMVRSPRARAWWRQ